MADVLEMEKPAGASVKKRASSSRDEAAALERKASDSDGGSMQSAETIQVVSVPDGELRAQLSDIILCLIVLICAAGVSCGLKIGSILWGRVRK